MKQILTLLILTNLAYCTDKNEPLTLNNLNFSLNKMIKEMKADKILKKDINETLKKITIEETKKGSYLFLIETQKGKNKKYEVHLKK